MRALPGVMSTVQRGGQFQVVVGQHVGQVDTRVRSLVSEARHGAPVDEAPPAMSWLDRAFDLLTGTFQPLLWALVGSSMIKTFLALGAQLGLISTQSTTYAIWAAAGNAVFYFLPVLVGITASLKLGANPYVGGTIAAALLHANFTQIGPVGTHATFLGLPVVVIDYGQSVFPALIAAILLSIMERALRRRLPEEPAPDPDPDDLPCGPRAGHRDPVRTGRHATSARPCRRRSAGSGSSAPPSPGAIMGGLWQVFVIFGVHWGFVPVIVNDLSVQGHSLLTGPLVAAVLAQGAAALAVMFRTRNVEMRSLAGAASVSAFVAGVTEPAIYGVTLRLRRPFFYACIGGMVGGGIAAAGGSAADTFVFPGLITLPAYMHVGNFTFQLVGTAAAVGDRVRADAGARVRGRASRPGARRPAPAAVQGPDGVEARPRSTPTSRRPAEAPATQSPAVPVPDRPAARPTRRPSRSPRRSPVRSWPCPRCPTPSSPAG